MLRIGKFRRAALWPGMALAAVAVLRPWLESSMAGHMAVEIPVLFAIGWLASWVLRHERKAGFSSWNASGVSSLSASSLILAFWMLPIALDMAVLDWRMSVAKVVGIVGAGFLTGGCWRRAGPIVQVFFLFNWCAMSLAAGLLYLDAPRQLCSVYLPEEQELAGLALVAWAVAVLAAWLVRIAKTEQRASEL